MASGPYAEFYENGNPKLEGEFIPIPTEKNKPKKSKLKIFEYWDTNNVLKATGGNGVYEDIDAFHNGHGKIKDGFKDGVWAGSDSKINYSYTETYANTELVSGVSIDSNKVEHSYQTVEAIAEPKNGIESFYTFIAKNFRVPEVDKLNGKIFTSFEIGTDGKLSKFKILRSIGYGTAEETLRVLSAYPEVWKPKEIRGIKLKMVYHFPINIQSGG